MAEIKWFKTEQERLAYLRSEKKEYPLKVAKKGTRKSGKKDKAD